jgi:hypothetical protein
LLSFIAHCCFDLSAGNEVLAGGGRSTRTIHQMVSVFGLILGVGGVGGTGELIISHSMGRCGWGSGDGAPDRFFRGSGSGDGDSDRPSRLTPKGRGMIVDGVREGYGRSMAEGAGASAMNRGGCGSVVSSVIVTVVSISYHSVISDLVLSMQSPRA